MRGLRSIASRLSLWSLLGSTVVIVASGLVLLGHLREQWLLSAHREGGTLAVAAANGIEAHIERVTEATRLLARLAASRSDRTEDLARTTLSANADLAGLSFTWVPDDPAAPPPAPFVDRLTDGTLGQRDLRGDATRYWEQPWFLHGLACPNGCWQQPFFSQSRQRRLINYSVAIQDNGRAVGLVNADVTLEWLQGVLGTLRRPDGAQLFVVDAQQHFLAHDRSTLLGAPASPALVAALRSAATQPQALSVHGLADVTEPSWIYSAPVHGTSWTLGLQVPQALMERSLRQLVMRELILGLLAMLGIALMILLVTRRTLAPLAVLTGRAEHVARGELDFALPKVRRRDEIGRLTQAFDTMRTQLALHLARLTRATREQERLRSELEIAHQIQVALLPNEHYLDAHCATFELHALLRPARAVGGDLYSYFMLDQQHFCVMVGDVSDKGIPAALFMARAITLAKALAPRARRPHQLLEQLNRELCRGNDSCMFITLLCGVLNTSDGRLVMASAGHEAPILCRAGHSALFEIETGPAIGLDEEASYGEQTLMLQAGDTLLMYTDGITEAGNAAGDMYGIERTLASLLRAPAPDSPSAFTDRLLSDVDAFAAGHDQTDDITILALSWHHHATQEERMLELTMKPTVEGVFDALDRCDSVLHDAGIAAGTREDVRLVLEELMVNMVQHGHDGSSDGKIRLRLRPSAEVVQVELHDNGAPFDPLEAAPPALSGDVADAQEIGGLGIHLVRAMASELIYNHDSEGNHLQLRFIHPDHTEPTP
ncbi:SpoIIE family protein phosphatase [Dyella sp. KULCS107]|uniref:SpoIIE family protein phosphatase n=1 Tax=Dyella sp. KULCS107 TaxID=3422216 RepID=UPI003D700AB2